MEGHATVKQAAAIAKMFKLDPVEVMNGTIFQWQVRVAAYNVIAEQERIEAAKMKNKK